jgi:hypothetical protein
MEPLPSEISLVYAGRNKIGALLYSQSKIVVAQDYSWTLQGVPLGAKE